MPLRFSTSALIVLAAGGWLSPTGFPTLFFPTDYDLHYAFKEGQTYRYEMIQEAQQVVEIMGAEQRMSSTLKTGFEIKGEPSTRPHNVTYRLKVTSLRLQFSNPLMDSTFVNPPQVVGMELRKQMNRYGDQLNTEKLTKGELGDALTQSFNVHSEILPNLPSERLLTGKAVRATDVDTISADGRTVISSSEIDFVLEGEEKRLGRTCLRVRYDGLVNARGEGSLQGNMKFALEGDGNVEGLLFFDPKEGIVVSDERTATLEMTAHLSSPQEMTLPITQVEKRSLTLVP